MKPKNRKGGARSRSTVTKDERKIEMDEDPLFSTPVSSQLAVGVVLRFVTTGIGAATSVGVTFNNLLDAMLIAGTATTGYQLFDYVKVRKVVMRGVASLPGSSPGSCTVAVEYTGLVLGSNGGGKSRQNTSVGTAVPAFVSSKPDKLSAAGMWQTGSNNVAFVLRAVNEDNTVNIGTYIDVHLSYKTSSANPATISSAIAAATPGEIYYGGIDGARLAATWARSTFNPRI